MCWTAEQYLGHGLSERPDSKHVQSLNSRYVVPPFRCFPCSWLYSSCCCSSFCLVPLNLLLVAIGPVALVLSSHQKLQKPISQTAKSQETKETNITQINPKTKTSLTQARSNPSNKNDATIGANKRPKQVKQDNTARRENFTKKIKQKGPNQKKINRNPKRLTQT